MKWKYLACYISCSLLAVRARNNVISRLHAHTEEVCGLKWSRRGNILASGGNENLIYIWDSAKIGSSNFLHCFKDHCAAVKALAWCPYQSDVLASGGGTQDGCIKIWNVQKGTCICSVDTKAQARQIIFASLVSKCLWPKEQINAVLVTGYLNLWSEKDLKLDLYVVSYIVVNLLSIKNRLYVKSSLKN